MKGDEAIVVALGKRLDELFDDEAVLKRSDIPYARVKKT